MSTTLDTTRFSSAARTAGTFVRFAFYLFGALLFAIIGYFLLTFWDMRPQSLGTPPSFNFAAPALTNLSAHTQVRTVAGARLEMRQYGQLYDRNTDMTAVMVLPAGQNSLLTRDFMGEIRDLRVFINAATLNSRGFYDLETRFGPVSATEFTINADGRTKLCIAWLTRYETAAVYFKGWFCEANGARPSFQTLACTLDRMTLERDLPSDEASRFLRDRMKRPARCTAEPVSQTVDTRARTPSAGVPYTTKLPVVRR